MQALLLIIIIINVICYTYISQVIMSLVEWSVEDVEVATIALAMVANIYRYIKQKNTHEKYTQI